MTQLIPWLVCLVPLALLTGLHLRLRRELQRLREGARHDAEQQALMRSLLDASPWAVILCEDAGRIVFENEPARRLFFEGQRAAGQNFLDLVERGPEALREALLGANDEMIELSVAGERETYHLSRRMFEHRGQPHTLLVVRSMTREIERRDSAVLKQVVRLISHEVNNSLAPVSSLVHSARVIVSSGDRIERLGRVFDTIDERARHLAEFISGYARLARLPRPSPQHVAWSDLLSRLSTLYPQAKLAAPSGAEGFFDPAQLEQALINLLKNANEAGGPLTAVQLEVEPLPLAAAQLRVLDGGAGFSPEALEQALLPFFTTKPGGSGVGLALVREVVHAHGGRLTLGARAGGGAEIAIWLPGHQPARDLASRARLTLTLTRT